MLLLDGTSSLTGNSMPSHTSSLACAITPLAPSVKHITGATQVHLVPPFRQLQDAFRRAPSSSSTSSATTLPSGGGGGGGGGFVIPVHHLVVPERVRRCMLEPLQPIYSSSEGLEGPS